MPTAISASAYGVGWLDVRLRLLPRRFIDACDPRMLAPFAAIDRELGHGVQVRRYVDGVDGVPSREGSFTACGFWAAIAWRGAAISRGPRPGSAASLPPPTTSA